MLMSMLGWEGEVLEMIVSRTSSHDDAQGGDPMTMLKDVIVGYRATGGERFLYLDRAQNILNNSCWVCPSSVVPPKVDQQPHVSYFFNVGDQLNFGEGVENFPNRMATRGPFAWRRCLSVREILDGSSSTIAMAERDLGSPINPRDILGRVAGVAATSPADCLATASNGQYLAKVSVLNN